MDTFDLDPCSPINRPWNTARNHYTIDDNGLIKKWFGRVWLNPPYGNAVSVWLDLMAKHNNGIALVSARTETKWFYKYIWSAAHSVLFLKGRLTFYNNDGSKANNSSGAPSCLIAYDENNTDALINSGLEGYLLFMNGIFIKET